MAVTGDESGQLKVWDMTGLMKHFGLTPQNPPAAPSLTELRLRRRGVTTIPIPPAPNPRQSFQDHVRGPKDLSDGSRMPVLKSWHAHDCVKRLSAIRSKRELISTGFDHLVRIWSLDGTLLGTLRQGKTTCEEWLFQPNTEAKIKALNLEAAEIMYDLGLGDPPEHLAKISRGSSLVGSSLVSRQQSSESKIGLEEHDRPASASANLDDYTHSGGAVPSRPPLT